MDELAKQILKEHESTDSRLAAIIMVIACFGMFSAGWLARSLIVSDLQVCETVTLRDGVGNKHSFEVCK